MNKQNTSEAAKPDLDALLPLPIAPTRDLALRFGGDPAELGYTLAQLGLTEGEIKFDLNPQQTFHCNNLSKIQTRNKRISEASTLPLPAFSLPVGKVLNYIRCVGSASSRSSPF